ncbi:MAG: MobB family relaxase [Bacteroidota bacterium]
MYVKINNPNEYFGNKESARDLVHYLEKENEGLAFDDKEHFFSSDEDLVLPDDVTALIDNNKAKLGKDDAKFFMLTINPSEEELNFLNNDPEKLKSYTRAVMDEYAANFNRTIDGKPLEGKDLLYFGKIEHERRYHPKDTNHINDYKHNLGIDREIKKDASLKERLSQDYIKNSDGTIIRPGALKAGNNTHIHVIVSRKDKAQRLKLSPFASARNTQKHTINGNKVQSGFDRQQFVNNGEKRFDTMFSYERSVKDSFRYKYSQKTGKGFFAMESLARVGLEGNTNTPGQMLARKLLNEALQNNPELQRVVNLPTNTVQMRAQLTGKAVQALAKAIDANPAGIPMRTVQKIVSRTIERLIRGIEF